MIIPQVKHESHPERRTEKMCRDAVIAVSFNKTHSNWHIRLSITVYVWLIIAGMGDNRDITDHRCRVDIDDGYRYNTLQSIAF